MSPNLGLLIVAGAVAACGVYMLLERSLIRMLLGMLLVGNAINLTIVVVSGKSGNPPISGRTAADRTTTADPLAQAMVLTAVVIAMGMAAFVLSMAYRLFVINTDDDVDDDDEDRALSTRSIATAPDRDRSDDPTTGDDTPFGDLFDDDGNPLTLAEAQQRRRTLIEADRMPEVSDHDDSDDFIDDPDPDDPDPDEPVGAGR
ncbi:Na(+)/H(+) antiporter subunit C [Williamsia sp. CHRR-6]|uniref:Na(+)/H(+) antiporter subunit C n=1 Tax=Williamsia sp. CHRR-6 TaxID=2835871 RepID=UPI001BD9FFB0|nr:Na(+)/H(+) antiporter subunit C [Williamsia sp. CHRR-6]MBT0567021.1 Na(+)/H(+) antiporter subunit C [Williamsia sp. CHRR-6]